ncbi:hypothetical protein G647_00444 [Cladophialophora carrionii CBS 160.54]|uniref:Uncharacterized protein n=1 Tax=Cladophialophora carrionii CBS 160.54 TaxID=1279043 RepID=V9DMA5_9EURO|nr:uncharacterized protein G647_00444 [Cladophialophora carrionii CBS 160.54]ETI27995.1 hypothetical protein G647_00444 [Cladophialophora carrionii CBS 160.54]
MPPSSLLRLPRSLPSVARPFYPARTPFRTLTSAPRRFAQQQDPEENPNNQRAAQLDREKIDRDPNEYSKSGTDESSAGNEEAAFDPNITDPQEAKEKAGEGNQVNPLDASPANPEISQGTSEEEGGAKPKRSERNV